MAKVIYGCVGQFIDDEFEDTIYSGSGDFTVTRTDPGTFLIHFTERFNSPPAVTASGLHNKVWDESEHDEGILVNTCILAISETDCKIQTSTESMFIGGQVANDRCFSFVAVGS